jgi:hypothetical protein
MGNSVLRIRNDLHTRTRERIGVGVADRFQAQVAHCIAGACASKHCDGGGEGLAILLALERSARAESDHNHAIARGAGQIRQQDSVARLAAQVAALDQACDPPANATVEVFSGG